MIVWNNDLSVNNSDIDGEHRRFISILNEVSRNLSSPDAEAVIEGTLKRLEDYAETHFTNEEKLLSDSAYPGLFTHKKRHNDFRQKIKEFKQSYLKDKKADNAQELLYFLQLWFIKHIKDEDKKFSSFMLNAEADGK